MLRPTAFVLGSIRPAGRVTGYLKRVNIRAILFSKCIFLPVPATHFLIGSDVRYLDSSVRKIYPDPGLFLKFTVLLLVKLDTDSNYVFLSRWMYCKLSLTTFKSCFKLCQYLVE